MGQYVRIWWQRAFVVSILLTQLVACTRAHWGRRSGHDGGDLAGRDAAKESASLRESSAQDFGRVGAADSRPDGAADSRRGPDLNPPADQGGEPACRQITSRIVAAQDDGQIHNATLFVDGEDLFRIFAGYWSGTSEWSYFRFALGQALPAGARITNATLSLWGETSVSWLPSEHALEGWFEATKDAAVVTRSDEEPYTALGRPLTIAGTRWPLSGGLDWIIGGYNVSPNIAELLQELIDTHGGLAATAHVQFWLRGAQQISADLAASDFKAPGYVGHPTRIEIRWCER